MRPTAPRSSRLRHRQEGRKGSRAASPRGETLPDEFFVRSLKFSLSRHLYCSFQASSSHSVDGLGSGVFVSSVAKPHRQTGDVSSSGLGRQPNRSRTILSISWQRREIPYSCGNQAISLSSDRSLEAGEVVSVGGRVAAPYPGGRRPRRRSISSQRSGRREAGVQSFARQRLAHRGTMGDGAPSASSGKHGMLASSQSHLGVLRDGRKSKLWSTRKNAPSGRQRPSFC
jgi:hypothetical protein